MNDTIISRRGRAPPGQMAVLLSAEGRQTTPMPCASISFARRSSRFSRSSSFSRSPSSLRSPRTHPALARHSLSLPRKREGSGNRPDATHLRSVSAVHPSFDVTEGIADHCESCSPWCSNTRRTGVAPWGSPDLNGDGTPRPKAGSDDDALVHLDDAGGGLRGRFVRQPLAAWRSSSSFPTVPAAVCAARSRMTALLPPPLPGSSDRFELGRRGARCSGRSVRAPSRRRSCDCAKHSRTCSSLPGPNVYPGAMPTSSLRQHPPARTRGSTASPVPGGMHRTRPAAR